MTSSSGSGGSGGAQVVADVPLTCFAMKRSDFERLLGPYEELWRYEALRKVRPWAPPGNRYIQFLLVVVWVRSVL